MSFRKLAILGFPAEEMDVSDEGQVRYLIDWLEEHYIKFFKSVDHEELREKNLEKWEASFTKYLAALNCPLLLGESTMKEIIDWLLDYAVDVIYTKDEWACSLTSARLAAMKLERKHQQKSKDPLSNIDFTNEKIKNGVEELRSTLGITSHTDPSVVLKACCKFIRDNLTDAAVQKANALLKTQKVKPTTMKLADLDMGMASTKDSQVDAAVRCLRLIHLKNLREIQTQINETIVAVQNLTADPKTDKRLGKVGF